MRRRAFLEIVMPPAEIEPESSAATAAQLGEYFGHDLADQPPITMKQLSAMRAYDPTPRLPELAGIPTLVISAHHDPVAPPKLGQALAAAIPGARFTELASASHGVTIQKPELVNEHLRAHIAGAEDGWCTGAGPALPQGIPDEPGRT
jgi:pimeloyl-ACP methyl ester carboxylesterase